MFRKHAILICALLIGSALPAQDSEYLIQIQVSYATEAGEAFQPVRVYHGHFDPSPANVVLNALTLDRWPRQIRLQMSFYSRQGLITPGEVIINGQKSYNTAGITYTITGPSSWPAQVPLKISLFSNWPAFDHWIDIPIAWNGQEPEPVRADLTSRGDEATAASAPLQPGHSVQAATFSKAPDAQKMAEFQKFGPVYYVAEPPFFKLRVGTFSTKEEALNQLNAIRRYRNGAYADAFYLYEKQVREVRTGSAQPQDYEATVSPGYVAAKGAPGLTPAAVPSAYDSPGVLPGVSEGEKEELTIQLSTYVDPPDLAAYGYLKGLGQLYIEKDGSLYRLKMGPFRSSAAAETALQEIRSAGFTYAFVKKQ